MICNRSTVFYIAGPMSGLPQYNFPAFDKARDMLRRVGFRVISPADMDREVGVDPTQSDFDPSVIDEAFLIDAMHRDSQAIIHEADAMVMLPGWQLSTGAKAEFALARWKHIPVYAFDFVEMTLIEKGDACFVM
jgi:hypothetical protein